MAATLVTGESKLNTLPTCFDRWVCEYLPLYGHSNVRVLVLKGFEMHGQKCPQKNVGKILHYPWLQYDSHHNLNPLLVD